MSWSPRVACPSQRNPYLWKTPRSIDLSTKRKRISGILTSTPPQLMWWRRTGRCTPIKHWLMCETKWNTGVGQIYWSLIQFAEEDSAVRVSGHCLASVWKSFKKHIWLYYHFCWNSLVLYKTCYEIWAYIRKFTISLVLIGPRLVFVYYRNEREKIISVHENLITDERSATMRDEFTGFTNTYNVWRVIMLKRKVYRVLGPQAIF